MNNRNSNIRTLKVNNDFKRNLPSMIYNNSKDYELYFVTFTFKDQFKQIQNDIITEYFKVFYQTLNRKTINNISKYKHLKSKMILIPEKSFDSSKGNLIKVPHYHGILMINKQRNNHFNSKCVLNHKELIKFNKTVKEFYSVASMDFNPNLIHQANKIGLKAYSTDIQKIDTDRKNITSVCSYMTKGMSDGYQGSFNASDVLFFNCTSNQAYKTYKPSKQLNIRKLYINTDDSNLSPFRRQLKASNNAFLDKFYKEQGLL